VIPEMKAVWNLCFFVEFLAELRGERRMRLEIKIILTKQFHFTYAYLSNRALPYSAGGVHLKSTAFW
jgi:hypothetical protein